jgi:hypothetical protein
MGLTKMFPLKERPLKFIFLVLFHHNRVNEKINGSGAVPGI